MVFYSFFYACAGGGVMRSSLLTISPRLAEAVSERIKRLSRRRSPGGGNRDRHAGDRENASECVHADASGVWRGCFGLFAAAAAAAACAVLA